MLNVTNYFEGLIVTVLYCNLRVKVCFEVSKIVISTRTAENRKKYEVLKYKNNSQSVSLQAVIKRKQKMEKIQ